MGKSKYKHHATFKVLSKFSQSSKSLHSDAKLKFQYVVLIISKNIWVHFAAMRLEVASECTQLWVIHMAVDAATQVSY